MIKAGIIGATGYAGNELVRLLMGHKEVEIKWYGSRSYIDQNYADIYSNFFIASPLSINDNSSLCMKLSDGVTNSISIMAGLSLLQIADVNIGRIVFLSIKFSIPHITLPSEVLPLALVPEIMHTRLKLKDFLSGRYS